LHIPFISYIYKLTKSYLANSLYLIKNIKAILKAIFGKDKSILNYLYATFISAQVSLPIAIICKLLSYIFINYNKVRTRDKD